jgi:hypothetical protein
VSLFSLRSQAHGILFDHTLGNSCEQLGHMIILQRSKEGHPVQPHASTGLKRRPQSGHCSSTSFSRRASDVGVILFSLRLKRLSFIFFYQLHPISVRP